MEHDTPISKDRWLRYSSIPSRMFSLRQYLVTSPVQRTKLTKPKMTLKPLPPSTSASKLVPKGTTSDLEDHRRVKVTARGDARGSVKADVGPINHFVCWFQTTSANLNVEAQKRALTALSEAASSILTNEWYDEGKSDAVIVAPVRSDLRRVEYSAEMAEIGFPPQG